MADANTERAKAPYRISKKREPVHPVPVASSQGGAPAAESTSAGGSRVPSAAPVATAAPALHQWRSSTATGAAHGTRDPSAEVPKPASRAVEGARDSRPGAAAAWSHERGEPSDSDRSGERGGERDHGGDRAGDRDRGRDRGGDHGGRRSWDGRVGERREACRPGGLWSEPPSNGIVFLCDRETEAECIDRRLFGTKPTATQEAITLTRTRTRTRSRTLTLTLTLTLALALTLALTLTRRW